MAIYEACTGKESIDFIIDSYEKVVNDLDLYRDIDMIDLRYVNILYSDKNGFNIIDTTDWQFRDNSYKRNLYIFNSSLTKVIMFYNLGHNILNFDITSHNIIDSNLYHNLDKFGNVGVRLKRILDLANNDRYHFLEYLFAYMEIYERFYGTNMKTLKDMQEMTKVLKKG